MASVHVSAQAFLWYIFFNDWNSTGVASLLAALGCVAQLTNGNLHPLLNGESLKNWPNGEFEKKYEPNMVHFQTDV